MDTEKYCEVLDCNETADCAHLLTRATTSKEDWDNPVMFVWLCRKHHQEQHRIGILTFCKKYGLVDKLQAAIAHKSHQMKPDIEN